MPGTWQPSGRYLQFKVVMKTSSPLETPGQALREVEDRRHADASGPARTYRVRNPHIVRPSLPFTHEDFGKLKGLRTRFELDKIVAGASTEFEAQLRLMRWAYEIPIRELDPYNWSSTTFPF